MTPWICDTCGVQHQPSSEPPATCRICQDERQYVGPDGQKWTSPSELAGKFAGELRPQEPDLFGIGMSPSFGIGQRALLVTTPTGNVLWDCIPLVDPQVVDAINDLGGVSAICFSHPHFYGSYADWADTFDAEIFVPSADREWLMRDTAHLRIWDGESISPVDGVQVHRIGGHFEGSSVLHWAGGAGGRGALLTGDTVQVVPRKDSVSFMWSYPNLIPLPASTVRGIADKVTRLSFDRIYGGWWDRVISHGAIDAVRQSAQRYVERINE